MGAVGTALLGPAVSGLFGAFGRHQDNNRQDSEIQRRVADGRRAGLSPLASIGASTAGTIPSSVGTTGQALGDAIGGYLDREHVEEKRKLENDLLRAQIKQSNAGAEADLINARSRSLLSAAAHPTRGVAGALGVGPLSLDRTPGLANAEDVQKRYDALVSMPAGLFNFGSDVGYTYGRRLYNWWNHTANPHRAAGVDRLRTGVDRTPRKYRGTSKM